MARLQAAIEQAQQVAEQKRQREFMRDSATMEELGKTWGDIGFHKAATPEQKDKLWGDFTAIRQKWNMPEFPRMDPRDSALPKIMRDAKIDVSEHHIAPEVAADGLIDALGEDYWAQHLRDAADAGPGEPQPGPNGKVPTPPKTEPMTTRQRLINSLGKEYVNPMSDKEKLDAWNNDYQAALKSMDGKPADVAAKAVGPTVRRLYAEGNALGYALPETWVADTIALGTTPKAPTASEDWQRSAKQISVAQFRIRQETTKRDKLTAAGIKPTDPRIKQIDKNLAGLDAEVSSLLGGADTASTMPDDATDYTPTTLGDIPALTVKETMAEQRATKAQAMQEERLRLAEQASARAEAASGRAAAAANRAETRFNERGGGDKGGKPGKPDKYGRAPSAISSALTQENKNKATMMGFGSTAILHAPVRVMRVIGNADYWDGDKGLNDRGKAIVKQINREEEALRRGKGKGKIQPAKKSAPKKSGKSSLESDAKGLGL